MVGTLLTNRFADWVFGRHTGRRAAGMELDPVYVDTALRRWQEFTGREPEHAETGRSFAAEAAAPCHD